MPLISFAAVSAAVRASWFCGLALGLAELANAGCSMHACTDMGCSPAAEVVFSRALDASKTYDITIVGDHWSATCPPTRPLPTCGYDRVLNDGFAPSASDGTPYPNGGFAGLQLHGQPSSFEITISDAGQVVASGKFENVKYRGIEINGPGCGTCPAAAVSMAVP